MLLKRSPLDGRLRVLFLITPLMALSAALFAVPGPLALGMTACGGVLVFYHMMAAAAYAALQDLTPNQMRGQVIAVQGLVVNIVGMGLGPTLIALVTDHVFRDESMVAYSVVAVCVPALILSWLLTIVAMRPSRAVRRAMIDAQPQVATALA